MARRIIIGVVLAGISIALLIWGTVPFAFEVLIFGVVGINEFYDLAVKKGIRPSRTMGMVAVVFLITFFFWGTPEHLPMLIIGMSLIAMLAFLFRKGFHVSSILDVGVTVLGFLYMGWFFSYLVYIRGIEGPAFKMFGLQIERGAGFVLLLIFSNCLTDVGAFFVGKFFGKHKFAPHISPKKTVEGAIGGFVGALAGAFLIGIPLKISGTDLVAIGLICGIFAQLGDLWASVLKRDVKVKDSGRIFLDHGGVLDRFDSILFTAPMIYYYLYYFYK